MRLPAHEATTAQLGAAYPFAVRRLLPGGGVLVGRDLTGGAFVHDPFELYRAGVLTNPNMLVLGQIGRGKSAFVKSYLYRHAAFGRRLIVLDPKGEYAPLANALGTRPIELVPGGAVRLNPLDLGLGADRDARRRRQIAVVCAIATALLGRELRPVEHALVDLSLGEASQRAPLLSEVVSALMSPSAAAARALRDSEEGLAHDGREIALSLRRLLAGELSGLFDAPTSPGVGLDSEAVVLDLSSLYHSSALGVAIVCVQAVLEELARRQSAQTMLVIDEAWALFGNLGAAQFLQSSLKLARARGVANVVVTHRLSDLAAAGEAGSVSSRLIEGLLADCETVVCYAQSAPEIPLAARALGLSKEEASALPRLRRGVALWRVGNDPHLVEHRLAAAERPLVDTDRALLGSGDGEAFAI
jgi:type IV secretory pathway VirB4 component